MVEVQPRAHIRRCHPIVGRHCLQLQVKQSLLAGSATSYSPLPFIQRCPTQMSMSTRSGGYTDTSSGRGNGMIRERKIFVTGATGNIGLPLVEHLAAENTVWAVARYSDSTVRDRVAATGAVTHVVDMASGDFAGLPDDFNYVVHLVTCGSGNSDVAVRVDGEGTALLLRRVAVPVLCWSCHPARCTAAPASRCTTIARPTRSERASSPVCLRIRYPSTYKRRAARSAARLYDLPVTIARMGTAYGGNGGLPAWHLDAIMAGEKVPVGNVDAKFVPIHEDDIHDQLEDLLRRRDHPGDHRQLGR